MFVSNGNTDWMFDEHYLRGNVIETKSHPIGNEL